MKLSFFSSDLSVCCLRFATVATILIMHPVAIPVAAGIEHKHNINILRLPMQTNIFADRGNEDDATHTFQTWGNEVILSCAQTWIQRGTGRKESKIL